MNEGLFLTFSKFYGDLIGKLPNKHWPRRFCDFVFHLAFGLLNFKLFFIKRFSIIKTHTRVRAAHARTHIMPRTHTHPYTHARGRTHARTHTHIHACTHRRMASTTSDTSDTSSSSKHNAMKTARARGPFQQLITAILTEDKTRVHLLSLSTSTRVFFVPTFRTGLPCPFSRNF